MRIRVPSKKVREKFLLIYELEGCKEAVNFTAVDFHVPVVVSSGVSDPLLVRKPMDLAALSSLFGPTGKLALDAVSANPSSIVTRNREKLSPKFVAPGIKLVREGKDC